MRMASGGLTVVRRGLGRLRARRPTGLEEMAGAFAATPTPTVVTDGAGITLAANRAATELFGIALDRFVGSSLFELTPGELGRALRRACRTCLGDGVIQEFSGDLIRQELAPARLAVVASEAGPGRCLWSLRPDPVHHADSAWSEPTELLRRVGAATWTLDLARDMLRWSDEMWELCGVERREVLNCELFVNRVHPLDRDDFRRVIAKALDVRESYSHEYRLVRPDGTVCVIESHGEVVLGGSGQPIALRGALRDVTPQRSAEFTYRTLAAALDASDDSITACKIDGTFTVWNRGAEYLYGYSGTEAIGQPRTLIIPLEERELAAANWDRVVSGEEIETEYVRTTKDGRRIIVLTRVSPMTDNLGAVVGVLTVGRDVTELKKTEAALADAHTRMHEESRLKSEFIANINHELRTPMNGLIGLTSLLAETQLSDEQREYVQGLESSGAEMMRVIDEILDFSRLERQRLGLAEQALDVRALVYEVRDAASPAALAGGVSLRVVIDDAVPLEVLGDPARLRQVLTNLVGNAVRFTDAGEVLISVSCVNNEGRQGARLRIEVVDTGIGIAPELHETIFRPFAQADGSTTRARGGRGLGLTIARDLVELMGGNLGVTSTPGAGSTFSIMLPLRSAEREHPASALPSLEGARILVVVNDDSLRDRIEACLRTWDVTVTTADDGAAAVESLRVARLSGHRNDVVIVDGAPRSGSGRLLQCLTGPESHGAPRLVLVASALPPETTWRQRATAVISGSPLRDEALYRAVVTALDEPASRGAGLGVRAMPAGAYQMRVLVAGDDLVSRLVAVRLLERRGFAVEVATSGLDVVEMHGREPFDAIFLDGELPAPDVYEVTREIRRGPGSGRHAVIIALTDPAVPDEREKCLAAGVDYQTGKPLSARGLDSILAQSLNLSTEGGLA